MMISTTRHLYASLFVIALMLPESRADEPLSLDQGLAIHVTETHGFPRVDDPVTFAFPLKKADMVKKTRWLVVLGPDGNPVPAQFRVLQRWNGMPSDKSKAIRWLLVDLQVTVGAHSEATYVLRQLPPADLRKKRVRLARPSPAGIRVRVNSQKIDVHTGTARFSLSRTHNNFLDRMWADLNGDGKVGNQELVVNQPLDGGFVLKDRLGNLYSSAAADVNVFVEEQGPLRTVIRADGAHRPVVPGSGIGRDFFTYRTRYTFYAGKPYVRVQHSLRNSYLDDPLGSIGFEAYYLNTGPVQGFCGAERKVSFGGDGREFVQAPGVARIYQDSHGGAAWADSPNTTFQGFKVYAGMNNPIAAGAQARGFMHVGTDTMGLSITMRDWFENFPKGFGFDGQQKMRFNIFPEEFSTFFWLDDGQQKTTDFLVCAHGQGGLTLADAVDSYLNPMHPYPDDEWIRETKAWGDQGDLDRIAHTDQEMINYDDGKLGSLYSSAFTNQSYSFGWTEFGEQIWARNTHTTGSPRNKLTYFDNFATTGSQSAFRMSELFALHSRDLRTYHIDKFVKEQHPGAVLWEGLPPWSHSTDKLGRDSLDPALGPHRAGIPSGGHGWNGFDIEHFTMDDLYEHYLMTGDLVTLDALKEAGECMRTWPVYSQVSQPGTTRGIGWGMRGLLKIYQVTGNPELLETANDLLASVYATYGQAPSPSTGIVYHYITKYPPHANHIADDEYDLPWQLAVVIHGMMLHHRETGNPLSRQLALDVADYLVDYGWNGLAMNEALANDDHNNFNYKGDNTGINTWIPSALALAYRQNPRPEYLAYAQIMYDSIPFITDPLTYNGYGIHHWWHSYRALILGD
ncbi:MAG: hypothetical protein V2A76_08585 [Planctomycetota bacterium]